MPAIVGRVVPVFYSSSSADFSASNVASHVLFYSTPFLFSSSLRLSVPRKSARRSRRRVVEAREGSSFAYSFSKELAHSHEELDAWQSATGNARVTRASVQGEECVSRGRILSADEGRHPWALYRQQARSVKASAMHHSRSSEFSEFEDISESYDKDDFIAQNQKQPFHNKSRSSPDVQHHNNFFASKKLPRAPLPTENQQSRLHNEVTIFKGITKPQTSWSPRDNDAHQFSLPEDATDAFSKGSPFIEEARRGDKASFMRTAEDSEDSTGEGQGAQVRGIKSGPKGKDTQMARPFDLDNSVEDATTARVNDSNQGQREKGNYNSLLAREHSQSDLGRVKLLRSKTARGDEAGFTSFNLFSSSPSVPLEADRSYPSTLLPMTTGVDDAFKGSRGKTQINLRSDDISSMKMEVDKDKTKGALGCSIEQDGNFVKFESQVASRISNVIESGKKEEQLEPWSAGKEDIMTQGAPDVEDVNRANLNATRVMPPKSSPLNIHHQSDDNLTDGFELSSDREGNVSAFAKSDLTFFPDCEDVEGNQSDIREFDDDEVSLFSSDTEDDVPTTLRSGEGDGRNAHDTSQLNASEKSSKDKEYNSPDSANWHKHNLPDLPFEFQFSYSETPQKPVLRYREPPFSPFGPSTIKRPWIGDRPNNLSKKKPRVLDSFNPPPPNLKGVKYVQDPGPYPEGQGPKTAKSREEIMGEPLTKEEIVYLVEKCRREPRQLNLGRDGLTHNMLDLIHSHWKRRRVCRIRCKGVPTIDMDNVKFHIEDKTGGKVIYQTGGVFYLFRGRNYNYKDRPYIPLMLWKPATPVYPKLIQRAPDGLTEEEVQRLRKLGRKVEPICKLCKNGVYSTLVDEVRAAFKVDELVRVDCRGLNPSDYKKIGAKLRDLVPCVLLSFDKEHILMWKGKPTAKGTSTSQASDLKDTADIACNSAEHSDPSIDEVDKKTLKLSSMVEDPCEEGEASNACNGAGHSDPSIEEVDKKTLKPPMVQYPSKEGEASGLLARSSLLSLQSKDKSREEVNLQAGSSEALQSSFTVHEAGDQKDISLGVATKEGYKYEDIQPSNYAVDIDALWEHAYQSGMAIELAEDTDIDLIVRKADELAQFAPLAPEYTPKMIHRLQLKRDPVSKPKDEVRMHFGRDLTQRPKKDVKRKFQLPTVGVAGMGGLPVDDLAKLLAKE
ncbi:hypothetical protein GOP47_0012372 [Adiantum capillus-veneris]|uniref:CRM domain-containing protein n=1 Tax=Adiantum capillus-veneris TaxID=13818 RepID=A0A9D4ZGS7_ADICA|nr:hypothetical protein GOP47_0012372 [Adiantum capillus-veneris]